MKKPGNDIKKSINKSALLMNLKSKQRQWITVKHYSPELVAAQWVKDQIKGVSYETIYQLFWKYKHSQKRKNKQFKNLYKFIRHRKRRRKHENYKDSRGLIPNRVSIDERPKIFEQRKRLGRCGSRSYHGKST